MIAWWTEFSKRAWVAHLVRAVQRFNVRGGGQLAAAIAYFSVLATVPILMLAFSGLGLTLTVLRPEVLNQIQTWLQTQLDPNSSLTQSLVGIVEGALTNWASIGLVGLAVAVWVSSGWIGNLKRAARLLMRNDVDDPGKQLVLPLDVLANFAGLVGLLLGVAATFIASAIAVNVGSLAGDWLGVGTSLSWHLMVRGVGLGVALAAGAGMFRLLFAWFSPARLQNHLAWVAAWIGSVGLLILQSVTGLLIGSFARNLGFAVFGSTIVLMLFLNLLSTLMLFLAAWLATASPAESEVVEEQQPEAVETEVSEARPGQQYVSAAVARRSLGIGLGTGYTVGTATGLGVGAALTVLFTKISARRRARREFQRRA